MISVAHLPRCPKAFFHSTEFVQCESHPSGTYVAPGALQSVAVRRDLIDFPMIKPEPTRKNAIDRRALLLGSCAAVGAAIPRGSSQLELSETPHVGGRQPLYRETEHVRTFYELSRF